ncbi:MAG: helix-turn-helix domain-containing protein [Lachnospiraceae bacterium]|nr:helix-turn-helix domain-containing protein [Lachnospiraceae bacterium]
MTFGEKLKEARKKAGLSQEELASRMCVSRSAVAKWETDKGVPDVENLKTMAKLMDVSIDYLLDDGTKLDLTVTREPIDLQGTKGLLKKGKLKCELVKAKFSSYNIYNLTATKKLSRTEKIKENALTLFTSALPGIGAFDSGTDIAHSIEEINNAYYLAEDDKKQFLIKVSDEFMEIQQPPQRITGKKFEIGNYKFSKVNKL